jgi:3-deoxy-D-manno-octulosonate 8-phosphate phosphatase (KDO 8-P phosphatase)
MRTEARSLTEEELREIAAGVKLLILDVDGVLTDGGIILDNDGNELKVFNVRDGHGLKMLMKSGVEVAIITGRYSKVVERRARELGITGIYQRCHIKSVAYEDIIEKLRITGREVAYVGDDIVDIPIFMRVGLPISVCDAADEAKAFSIMVTKNRGGRGAVREVCDFILKAKGHWDAIMREYVAP